jgi:hypothetical protein
MIRYELLRAAELSRITKNADDGRAAPGHSRRLSTKFQKTLFDFFELRMPRENDLFKIVPGIAFASSDTPGDTPTCASPNLSLETIEFIL